PARYRSAAAQVMRSGLLKCRCCSSYLFSKHGHSVFNRETVESPQQVSEFFHGLDIGRRAVKRHVAHATSVKRQKPPSRVPKAQRRALLLPANAKTVAAGLFDQKRHTVRPVNERAACAVLRPIVNVAKRLVDRYP